MMATSKTKGKKQKYVTRTIDKSRQKGQLQSKGNGGKWTAFGNPELVYKLEQNYKISIDIDDKTVPWTIRHASWLLSHYQKRSNGCTGYQNARGYPYEGKVMTLFETCKWRIRSGTRT